MLDPSDLMLKLYRPIIYFSVSMSFKNFQTMHPYNADSSRKLYSEHDYEDSSDEETDEEAETSKNKIIVGRSKGKL